jgi:hypothetical protein
MLAAAQISRTLRRLEDGAAVGGSVWQMDVISRDVVTSTVIGVDACPRCGLQRPFEGRTFRELITAFQAPVD